MEALKRAIQEKTAKVVVLGLGYVGLPVACMFARAGFQVMGIRRNPEKAEQINRGICPIEGKEPGLAELLAEVVKAGRLRATTDYSVCHEAQVILIAVETPVDEMTKKPQYAALRSALTSLGAHLQPETLVIVESTLAPGTMQRLVAPLLEETSGLQVHTTHHAIPNPKSFYLVHCPERVMPGKLLTNIENCHRVVGGMSPEAAEAAVELYRHIVRADLDIADCLTAELVKTAENAYRDVQIAFANEVALLCEDLGADVWRVRELVNKSPHRDMHLPGAGVGGHCIPKDPWLLISGASDGFEPRLIPAARAINDGMPLHMADLVARALAEAGRAVQGAKVAVLGYAYIENSDDARNSPSIPLIARLEEWGAEVVVHDPWARISESANPGMLLVRDAKEAVKGADAIVLMVAHEEYRQLSLAEMRQAVRTPVLVDGRHIFGAEEARQAGFIYRGVGIGEVTMLHAS